MWRQLEDRLRQEGLEDCASWARENFMYSPAQCLFLQINSAGAAHANKTPRMQRVVEIIGLCNREAKASAGSGSRITVAVRKRRPSRTADLLHVSAGCVTFRAPKVQYDTKEGTVQHAFQYDVAFDEHAANEKIFEKTVTPLVQHALGGGCSSVIAYGQTGTGKTHTMLHRHSGVVYQSLRAIQATGRRGTISFFEIYMGRINDCLGAAADVQIFEKDGAVYFSELHREAFGSLEEAEQIIEKGSARRTTRRTDRNEESSRSHAAIFVEVGDAASGCVHGYRLGSSSAMVFMDLAGSERGSDRRHAGSTAAAEGAEINKSLLVLKECIRGLCNGSRFLPFRQSKLTQILKNLLVGNCRTLVLATVSAEPGDAEHTLNTLRYAARIKEGSGSENQANGQPDAFDAADCGHSSLCTASDGNSSCAEVRAAAADESTRKFAQAACQFLATAPAMDPSERDPGARSCATSASCSVTDQRGQSQGGHGTVEHCSEVESTSALPVLQEGLNSPSRERGADVFSADSRSDTCSFIGGSFSSVLPDESQDSHGLETSPMGGCEDLNGDAGRREQILGSFVASASFDTKSWLEFAKDAECGRLPGLPPSLLSKAETERSSSAIFSSAPQAVPIDNLLYKLQATKIQDTVAQVQHGIARTKSIDKLKQIYLKLEEIKNIMD
ncbi:kinesin family member 2/24 [Pancytospora philotis]|nr:kinesin family member 2/24 [Pancytospora philotis]